MASKQKNDPRARLVSATPRTRCNISGPGGAAVAVSLRRVIAQTSMVLLVAAAASCSSDSGSATGTGGTGSGGHVSSGGSVASGGSQVGSGGSASGGSQVGSGGSASGGSRVGSGGSASGGATQSGGTSGSGGVAAGGVTGTGGASTGGTTGTSDAGTGSGGRTLGQGGSGAGGMAGQGGSGFDGSAGQGGRDAGGVGGQAGTGGSRPDGGLGGTGGSTGTTFNPCTAGAACKIMPLGDSITEGYGASGNVGGYRIELFRQAVKSSKNITFIGSLTNGPSTVENKTFPKNHEGHGGWTISQISGIVRPTTGARLMTAYPPNIVLLKIGTNDVNGTGASSAPTNLKTLINQITEDAPSALLVVSSIIPIKDDNTNTKVKTYNATIPTAVNEAAAAGKHVIFVDSYAAFVAVSSWKTTDMSDNLHPNDTGYALLGQTWYGAIGAVLPAGP